MPPSIVHRRAWYGILPLLCGTVALAQDSSGASVRAIVRGVVWDSVAGGPLAGATVQLIRDSAPPVTRSTRSDSVGRYALDVPAGRYTIGFLHELLDSLGIEPALRAVHVRDGEAADVPLAIPSPRRIRAAICGPEGATGENRGVVLGFVRDARDGSPVPGAVVTGEWLEYEIVSRAVGGRRARVVDTAGTNGWFAICHAPEQGRLVLDVGRPDSNQRVEVEIAPGGFARRDVYVDVLAGAVRYRLSGRVLAAATRQPLSGAEVSVAGGVATRTDANGGWELDAPAGTRMLDIRAIGYYPLHRAVDVVPHAPALRVELLTMRAILDTVRVTATRLTRNMQEFEQRRRASGFGQFLSHEDIRRLNAVLTTDVFKMVRGVDVLAGSGSPTEIYLRGVINNPNQADRCRPDLYVDGVSLDTLMTADLVDALTRPEDVAGIEVYRAPFVPPQYSRTLGGCGSIVVWTMPPSMPERSASGKRRLLKGTAIVGAGLAFGIMIRSASR